MVFPSLYKFRSFSNHCWDPWINKTMQLFANCEPKWAHFTSSYGRYAKQNSPSISCTKARPRCAPEFRFPHGISIRTSAAKTLLHFPRPVSLDRFQGPSVVDSLKKEAVARSQGSSGTVHSKILEADPSFWTRYHVRFVQRGHWRSRKYHWSMKHARYP